MEADPDQFVIIISYTTEERHLDANGNTIASDSKNGTKTVRVPRDLAASDVGGMAQDIMEKYRFIPSSKQGEVERLLVALMEHAATAQEAVRPSSKAGRHSQQQPMHPQQQIGHDPRQQMGHPQHGDPRDPRHNGPPPSSAGPPQQRKQQPLLPHATVHQIDEYTDQLYEDQMELKVQGAKCILRVCTEASNLEILADHDTLLSVLKRELQDSSKKSFELSVAIACTFLCFTHFSQFHPVLMANQCGDVTMRVLEYESQRHLVRKEEHEKKMAQYQELHASGLLTGEHKRQMARDEKKYKIQMNRQNKLMLICLMALLNLAEEIAVERKMVNRKMPQLLTQTLERDHEDVLLVTMQFIKKLSVFEENKEMFSKPETLSRLVQLAQSGNVRVALLALRILFNLSFDEHVRSSLVESGVVKLLVDLLRSPPFRHIVLRLLYHFSMNDRCKSLMAFYQDGMMMLLQLVVHFPEARVGKDLVALVVNLATHQRCAEVMVASGLYQQVVLRVLKTRDPLLCKVLRHVVSHGEVMDSVCELLQSEGVRMARWMYEFVRMALCCVDNPDLLVEVLGTLANITRPDVPWADLCEAGLLDLLHRLLVPSFSEDDILLECVMIIGNIADQRESAERIAGSRLPGMLQGLLIEKREDEEIVLQTLFAFECLLQHDEVRDVVLQDTEIAPHVMRFAKARNPNVADQSMKVLQVLADHCDDCPPSEPGAPSWADQIKLFRFEQHNSEWCRSIARELAGGSGMSPDGRYEECSGDEEEEEFAFRWAGGDAMDIQELANRNWKEEDMQETFMRSSRCVS